MIYIYSVHVLRKKLDTRYANSWACTQTCMNIYIHVLIVQKSCIYMYTHPPCQANLMLTIHIYICVVENDVYSFLRGTSLPALLPLPLLFLYLPLPCEGPQLIPIVIIVLLVVASSPHPPPPGVEPAHPSHGGPSRIGRLT